MKIVGIIGGLGPDTTANFYINVIRLSANQKNLARPSIVIANVPISYAVEKKFIQENKGIEEYLPLLIHEAQRLEKAEADFLVIPCNSVHVFIQQVRQSVKIPVLSIVEETVSFLKRKNVHSVGIVSSLAVCFHKSCN